MLYCAAMFFRSTLASVLSPAVVKFVVSQGPQSSTALFASYVGVSVGRLLIDATPATVILQRWSRGRVKTLKWTFVKTEDTIVPV